MFVDRAKINIRSGKGGDGGKGGDVVFKADNSLRTLMDFRYKRKYQAENGQNGMKKKRFGKKGADLIIKVPPGTMIIDEESGALMKDLINHGDSFVAAKGGKGGKGNVHFKSSIRQAPNFAEAGGVAKERNVILELKLIADVGLVGFPNVGKSSLLSTSSKAKPKIANYHFTTIEPNLGVVEVSNTSFVLADIAGIIEGAHQGAGMGFKFLKHIERTKIIIHVVDISGSEGRDPIEDFETINKELRAYSNVLANKPQIVAANKIDLIEDNNSGYELFKEYAENQGYAVFPISAPINLGVPELMAYAAKILAEVENTSMEEIMETFDFEREDTDDNYRKVEVRRDNHKYVIEGKQLTKIFNSTNFNDIGSVRYLYKYIEKSGAIEKLKSMGLKEGDTVCIRDFEFEYIDEF